MGARIQISIGEAGNKVAWCNQLGSNQDGTKHSEKVTIIHDLFPGGCSNGITHLDALATSIRIKRLGERLLRGFNPLILYR